jgi:Tfp pilus assembly protein PilV
MRKSQIGDTIVEVMAAITIIGLALATAYALSNRSYRTGQTTVERTQALALAQGQVEFLKNLNLNGEIASFVQQSVASGPFCFNDDTGTAVNASATDSYCKPYADGLYNVAITYSGSAGTPPGVFTVNVTWDKLGGGQNQLEVYYKAS